MSINNSIKVLENIKQGFKTTVSWKKYKSEIRTEPKTNNLNYMSDPTLNKIYSLFVLSFKNGDGDPTRNYFGEH